jgi:hypothetical protein
MFPVFAPSPERTRSSHCSQRSNTVGVVSQALGVIDPKGFPRCNGLKELTRTARLQ